ncbi:MAG: HAD-IC family P-type ATPase [bacterium]|nr:HAD-IC family P-type ATPase [bacterium]
MWHSTSLEETYKRLDAGPDGFSPDEARKRLVRFGRNEFARYKQKPLLLVFLRQLRGPLNLVLIVAAGVSYMVSDMSDAVVILVTLAMNASVGFFQESKADRAFVALSQTLQEYAYVLRGGHELEIPREEVVPGDVLLLKRGKKIPADARVVASDNLQMNESSLTGEWIAQKKKPGIVPFATPVADRSNMVFMGTLVDEGSGRAIVVSTGIRTEFGQIGTLLREEYEVKTPLERRVAHFSSRFAYAIGGVAILLFWFGVSRGVSLLDMFLTAVAMAVASVPEGLPVSLTIVLAIGMQRILKKGGLVRNLFSTETLGGVSIVATDKTGTLTKAEMLVSHIITATKQIVRKDGHLRPRLHLNGKEAHMRALEIAMLESEAVIENPEDELHEFRIHGGATNKALLLAGIEAGLRKEVLLKTYPLVTSIPFDSERKFSASLHETRGGYRMFVLGAPELVLNGSLFLDFDGKKEKLTPAWRESILKKYGVMAGDGLRVIAAAYKDTREDALNPAQVTEHLVFVGLLGLKDPVREDVRHSIQEAEQAGIRPIIITGDHARTAEAVAREVGIFVARHEIIEGEDFEKLSDEELRDALPRFKIYARIAPKDKLRIVEAWRARGETVAFVGDGINDAPALRKADIGVALGSGTDVAKEAADLVLLSDSFTVIIDAVREGRTILANIKKTILFLLTDGFNELLIIVFGLVAGVPLPILPAQILWINLVEDILPALSLAFEKGDAHLRPLTKEKRGTLLGREGVLIILWFSIITTTFVFATYLLMLRHFGAEYARTMVFLMMGIDSLFYIFNIKTMGRMVSFRAFFDNAFMLVGVFVGFLLLVSAVLFTPLQNLIKTVPVSSVHWGFVFAYGVGVFLMMEGVKRLLGRKDV